MNDITNKEWLVNDPVSGFSDFAIWVIRYVHPRYMSGTFLLGLCLIQTWLEVLEPSNRRSGLTYMSELTGLLPQTLIAIAFGVSVLMFIDTKLERNLLYNMVSMGYAMVLLLGAINGELSPLGVLPFWYIFSLVASLTVLMIYQAGFRAVLELNETAQEKQRELEKRQEIITRKLN